MSKSGADLRGALVPNKTIPLLTCQQSSLPLQTLGRRQSVSASNSRSNRKHSCKCRCDSATRSTSQASADIPRVTRLCYCCSQTPCFCCAAAEAPATKKLRVQPDLIEEAHITQVGCHCLCYLQKGFALISQPVSAGLLQMSAQAGHDTSRADATRAGTAQQNQAKPSDKDMQDKPSKKKAAMHAAAEPTVRAETDAEEGLSTADMAQLLQLAQLAKQHNPDLLDNPVNPPEREQTGSIQASKGKPVTLAAHSTATADHSNVPPAITEGERPKGRSQVSQTSAQKQRKAGRAVPTSLAPQPNADALQQCVRGPLGGIAPQPKPKKQKSAAGLRASTTNTEALSTDAIGAPAAASDAKAATAEEGMADGGDPSDAPSGKATSGKLGRNARLRLKRQLRRQQQQLGDSQQQGDPHDANEDEDLEPFVALGSDIAVKGKQTSSLKPNTARTAVPAREKELEPAAIKAHQPTGPGSQHLSQIEKKRNKHAAAAASSVTAAASPAAASPAAAAAAAAASPAAASSAAHPAAVTQKKGKGGLLEQMRSKLSGGRFRMLNEQLYTAPGQEAFELMQGDPALFEQYHEVSHRPLERCGFRMMGFSNDVVFQTMWFCLIFISC